MQGAAAGVLLRLIQAILGHHSLYTPQKYPELSEQLSHQADLVIACSMFKEETS